jgi:hypothetical protein
MEITGTFRYLSRKENTIKKIYYYYLKENI